MMAMCLMLICTFDSYAQLTLNGVAIPGVGSSVDASKFPEITVRFRATLNGQPTNVDVADLYLLEINVFRRVTSLTQEGSGIHTLRFTTSTFSTKVNSTPTATSANLVLYAVRSGDVGQLPITWDAFPASRGGSIFVVDSLFRRVPFFLDLGDVTPGSEVMRKLNLRTFAATIDERGNERRLMIDSLKTSSSNFRIVWKGTYGAKAPPVSVDAGTDYRFDLYCKPSSSEPISDVLTIVYEGGMRHEVMLFANTPTYKPTTILKLLTPNGGENLAACQDVTVAWKGAIQGFHAHVEYSTDGGSSWKFIDSTLDSTLRWQVPVDYTDKAKIRVYQKQGASGARWLYGERSPATNIAFSENGRYLAVAHQNGIIVEWDVATSTKTVSYVAEGVVPGSTKVTRLSYLGNSRSLAAIVDRPAPAKDQLLKFELGTALPVAKVDIDHLNAGEVISDSLVTKVYVAGTMSARLRVYDGATLAAAGEVLLGAPSSAARSTDGILVLALINGDVLRFDPNTGKERYRFQADLPRMGGPAVRDLSVSRSNRLIALAGEASPGLGNAPQEQRTLVYDTQTNSLIRVIYREGSNVVGVTINPSETYITMGFAGQPQIRQYDVVNRQILGPIPGMPGHSQLMTDVEYGADGSTLASCSEDTRDNLLLRRIITPESDESDATFRIVPLDVATPQLSFGVQYIGATIDTLIGGSICNNGIVPVIFERGDLQIGSWLALRGTIQRDTIRPGECLRVQFRAVPKDTGSLADTLELYACERIFRIPIVITSIDRNLATFGDMTNFGDVCVRDTARKTFVIVRNDDPIPVVIDGISMRKGISSQYRVRGYRPGDTLQPGESMSVEVLFIPRQRGHDTDQVVISYAGQSATARQIRVLGRGAGADIDISHPILAFISDVPERSVVLSNRTGNPITLSAATFTSGAPFTTSTVFPVVIPPADSLVLPIRHTGGTISGSDELVFEVTPCAATSSIRLVQYQGTASVWMRDVRVDPRTAAELPIVANIAGNVPYKGVRPLELVMQTYQRHFYADSLRVIGGSGEIVSQRVDGDVRSITLRMNSDFAHRESIIAYVIGRAGIAEFDSSLVTFDTAARAFGAQVQTSYKPGLLRIANPNPYRHVFVTGGPIVRSISPLPAFDAAHVTIESPISQDVTLKVVDQQGAIVFESKNYVQAGVMVVDVDVRQLTPGVYTVIASSAASTHATSMVVLKP
jgi:WD40 repeat protein